LGKNTKFHPPWGSKGDEDLIICLKNWGRKGRHMEEKEDLQKKAYDLMNSGFN
jgi:hypothetical protein